MLSCGWTLAHGIELCFCLLLQTQEMTGNLAVNKGEYWCPLCRQLANSVIPIPPEEDQFTIKRPLSSDPKQLIKDVADMMVSRPITPVCTTFGDNSFYYFTLSWRLKWVFFLSKSILYLCDHVSVNVFICMSVVWKLFTFLTSSEPKDQFPPNFSQTVSLWRFLKFKQMNMILI